MRKYYIATIHQQLEKNKPLINVCALFRTENEAREYAEGLAKKMEETPVIVLEVSVRELHLVVLSHKSKGEIIVGMGNKARAESFKAEHSALFPNYSFIARPFQETDFTEKMGAFYA